MTAYPPIHNRCNEESNIGGVRLLRQKTVLSPEAALKRAKRKQRDRKYALKRLQDPNYRQKKRALGRAWRRKNVEYVKAKQKAYRANNPERMRILGRRCRDKGAAPARQVA